MVDLTLITSLQHAFIFLLYFLLKGVTSNPVNSTNITETSSRTLGFYQETVPQLPTQAPEVLPDIISTILVIMGCVFLGVGIAKLSDVLYDHVIDRKEKKNQASEHARNMLRARAAVMQMRPTTKNSEEAAARSVAAKWMGKAAEGRASRFSRQLELTPSIKVSPADNAQGKTNPAFVIESPTKTSPPDNNNVTASTKEDQESTPIVPPLTPVVVTKN